MPLLVFDHPDMESHDADWAHAERPDRLRSARAGLASADGLLWCRGQPIGPDELAAVHDPAYVGEVLQLGEALREAEAASDGEPVPPVFLDPDTPVGPGSVEAALLAAGAVRDAVDAVLRGPDRRALCLVRPPGHHARFDRAMGFCLFNNVVVGLATAKRRGVGRVWIVDWDVHHGNGTQELVEGRADVLFASTHQGPGFYPGTGDASSGNALNVPLPAGAGHDALLAAFDDVLLPAAEAFAPELVLVSAGFDAHRDDPLGGLTATEETFAALAARVRAVADAHAGGRLVVVLEGGYDLRALGRSVRAVAEVLAA